jgi:hypothetical protein
MSTLWGGQLTGSGTTHWGVAGLGVPGASVPSTGTHGPAAAYPYLSLPSQNAVEVRWRRVTDPSAGTFDMGEDTGFSLTGAPDGSYTFVGELFFDGVSQGNRTHNITIGSASTTYTSLASLTAAVRQLTTATAGLTVAVRQGRANTAAVNAFVQAGALQVSAAATGAVRQGRTASAGAAGAVGQRITRAALLSAQVQAASPEVAVQLLAAVRAQRLATVGLAAYVTDGTEPLPASLFSRFTRRRIRRIGRSAF